MIGCSHTTDSSGSLAGNSTQNDSNENDNTAHDDGNTMFRSLLENRFP